ncbi:MAG TPA: TIGR03619 family F420-dependent LLM class oxidoreductase [Methylomirabilota bacterium]|jgi:probable F420-dependent oxidoreductase|nr:TIGR03619 family F420-dependent LLM class oxidoreductase [Methylomirabilota bacterium]
MNYGVVLPIWQLTAAEAETLAMRAEELGIDGVFVPDHILAKPATTQHYGGHWPDPFSLLAFLAGRTERIRLGASVIVLPYRHALVVAKAAATVDQVSRGRFIFGVGVGWDEAEFTDLRLPFAERGAVSDDALRAIKAAWASDVPEYRGRYVSFSGATFAPRPVQRPHPPIWVGGAPGAVSTPAVRRCAELGDAWHPLGLALDDIEKGYATLRDLAARRGRREPLGLAPRNLLDLTDSAKGAGRAAFQGSVAEVAADIRRVRSLGASWMTFDLPRDGVPAMTRAMERLAREVKTTAS